MMAFPLMALSFNSARATRNGNNSGSNEKKPKAKNFILGFYFVNNIFILVSVFVYWKIIINYHKIYVFIGIGIALILTISLISLAVKVLCQRCYKELSDVQKCKTELLFGYGGITICGYINSVFALVLQRHPFLLLIAFICYISSAIIYLIFIGKHLSDYQIPPPYPIKTNICGGIFVFLGTIEFIVITLLFGDFIGLNPAVAFGLICFFLVKIEILSIVSNGVRLKDTPAPVNYSVSRNSLSDQLGDSRSPSPYEFDSDDEELRVPRTVIAGRISPESVVITVVSSSNASDCNICLLQYSNHVIPRILVGCGHTFCQTCIGKLPKTGARVTCPLCRIFTMLPCGRADLLPKNFTVIDMIQERNL